MLAYSIAASLYNQYNSLVLAANRCAPKHLSLPWLSDAFTDQKEAQLPVTEPEASFVTQQCAHSSRLNAREEFKVQQLAWVANMTRIVFFGQRKIKVDLKTNIT